MIGEGIVGVVVVGGIDVFVCGISCVVVGVNCVLCGVEILICVSGSALAGKSIITSLPPRTAASTAIEPRSATMVPKTTGKYISEAKNILRADALSTRRRNTNAKYANASPAIPETTALVMPARPSSVAINPSGTNIKALSKLVCAAKCSEPGMADSI